MRVRPQPRPAATLVEFAMVGSVTMLLLIGMVVGGLGIYRYQQVARLARAASRYASVHGTQYASDTGNSAATATDVYNNAIVPNAAGLDTKKITYSVTWSTSNSPTHSTTTNGVTTTIANTVTVTVNYSWIPEAYLGGITLNSSSTTVMQY